MSLTASVALGLRALAGDVESARSRYAEQAAALARAVVGALETEGRRVEHGEAGALDLRASAEGRLLEPALPERPPAIGNDKSLRDYLARDVDALEREGRGADAEKRLREIAARETEPDPPVNWLRLAPRAKGASRTLAPRGERSSSARMPATSKG